MSGTIRENISENEKKRKRNKKYNLFFI